MTRQLVVLCSNFSVGALFSRGCLLPGFVEPPGTIEDTWLTLRSANNRLPASWVSSLVGSGRNVIPIGIVMTSGTTPRHIHDSATHVDLHAVCLSDVAWLAFRSEKEMERLRSLEFSNYDLTSSSVQMMVRADLFEAPETEADGASESLFPATPDTASLQTAVRSADCVAGLVASLVTQSPGVKSWMTDLQAVFKKPKAGTLKAGWPRRLLTYSVSPAGPPTSAGEALLMACASALRKYPVEEGWPTEEVLTSVTTFALERAHKSEKIRREIEVWASRAVEIVASRAEPQSLADDAFVAERAVLLVLLRGDTTGLEEQRSSEATPGAQVSGLAMAMAGYRTGLRALPSSFKRHEHWLRYLGELFVDILANGAGGPSKEVFARLKIDYRSERPLHGEWTISVDGSVVKVVSSHFDRGLERVYALGKDLGYELQEFGDDQLVATVQVEDSARYVHLEIIRGPGKTGASVRFCAPAVQLIGPLSKSRIPKEMLIGLLTQHSNRLMSCRFAIDTAFTRADVVADQLLSTLDEAEFKFHLLNVATVASELLTSRQIGSVKS